MEKKSTAAILKAIQSIRQDMDAMEKRLDSKIEGTNVKMESMGKTLHMEIIGTQNDFLKFKDDIVYHVLKQSEKIDRLEKNSMTKEEGQKIIDHIDSAMLRMETTERKNLTQDHRLNELEAKTASHETRLSKLETN
jgi:hypothetical protein